MADPNEPVGPGAAAGAGPGPPNHPAEDPGGPPEAAARPPSPADVGRRRFFRTFASEIVQTAATVAGAAQALQRASAEAAGAILDPTSAPDASAAGEAGAGPTGFRTSFREEAGILYLVDQRRLPEALVEHECRSASDVSYAIRQMTVRGAPAIGQVAAIGLALTAHRVRATRPYARRATLRGAANALTNARPTAVNLSRAVERVMARYYEIGDLSEEGDAIADAMREEADAIVFEAATDHGRLAEFGLAALEFPSERPLRILTHGNTGPLACGQFGTALGVIQAAHHAERSVHVWVGETRPYLQGARLTAWELMQAGVPHALLPDSAAGHLMSAGEVDVVLVGADRVAANGDTASTIGTYPLAVMAARHGVPFFVCAPLSSVDLSTPDGSTIPIEERPADEVLRIRSVTIAPPGTEVRNPAFDVTPADLIGGIVTEEGVIRTPFEVGLRHAFTRSRERVGATTGFTRASAGEPAVAEPAPPSGPTAGGG